MISYRQVELTKLPVDKRAAYAALIHPATFDLFNPKATETGLQLTFFAFENEQPIGMIATFAYPSAIEALLVSYFVHPIYRARGIGTALMQKLLEALQALSIRIAQITYTSDSTAAYLEKICAKTGWSAPTLISRRYYLDQYSFHPNWYFSPSPLLPEDCSVFSWQEATKEELALAKQWVATNPAFSAYTPFDKKEPEYLNSLGLRHLNHLAGWMVTHRLEPKLIRYSALYTLPEIRGQGPAIWMLKESIRRHLQAEIDTAGLFEINFTRSSPNWIHFIEKRLAPSASRLEEVKKAYWLVSY